jgi:hypothetical protein
MDMIDSLIEELNDDDIEYEKGQSRISKLKDKIKNLELQD